MNLNSPINVTECSTTSDLLLPKVFVRLFQTGASKNYIFIIAKKSVEKLIKYLRTKKESTENWAFIIAWNVHRCVHTAKSLKLPVKSKRDNVSFLQCILLVLRLYNVFVFLLNNIYCHWIVSCFILCVHV